ncbi:Polygalacturonase At1g48100 [Linum perenne]
MKNMRSSNPLFSLFLITTLVVLLLLNLFSRIPAVDARNHHYNNNNRYHKNKPHNPPAESAPSPPHDQSAVFDILSFGARGDGATDDSKALAAAWTAACQVQGSRIQIPSGFIFLINPTTFQGPCMPGLILQVDGTLAAPPQMNEWPRSSLFQWLNFKWVHNFTIQGSGALDGQGSQWWTPSSLFFIQALRFYASYGVTVRDISIVNSPQCHLKFDFSKGIKVDNLTISSPEYSPNTDGIHLQSTQDVEIQHSNIGCGDDCVSIQTGCSNIHIHHINCSPGHGISVGSLGRGKTTACVSNIHVENVSLQNTLAGVRIKTWQGGVGSVKNVTFSNIQVTQVKYPIIIDQFYCDKHTCRNQTNAVAISGVRYDQITGTYSVQPIHLACSSTVPCVDVNLVDIQLNPAANYASSSSSSSSLTSFVADGRFHFQQGMCQNSYGKSGGRLVPASIDDCLRKGSDYVKRVSRSHEHVFC